MGKEEVHIVQVHPPEALVQARHQILPGTPFPVGAGPHVMPRLGGDEQFVAVGSEGFLHDYAEGFLGGAVGGAVIVGQVEVDDPVVKGVMGHLQGVRQRVHIAEVVP